MEVSMDMTGLDAVLAKLETVEYDVRYKGGRFALRKAASVVRDAVIAGALRLDDAATPESIAKNVAIRWSSKTFRRTGDLAFRVGILGGARAQEQGGAPAPGGHTFYFRFLEFGTQNMAARPFIRQALSANAQKATTTFIQEYEKALDRAIRRAGQA